MTFHRGTFCGKAEKKQTMSERKVAALCHEWNVAFEARRRPAVDAGDVFNGEEATELILSRPGEVPFQTIVYVSKGGDYRPLALWALYHLVEMLKDGRYPSYDAWIFEGDPPNQPESILLAYYHRFARSRYQRACAFFGQEEIEALALAF